MAGPKPTRGERETIAAWARKFLSDEERATASLQAFFREARDELEEFIRTGPLTKADQAFYGNLLQQVDGRATALLAGSKDWIDQTIPQAYVTGARTNYPDMRFNAINDDAVKALSKGTLDLITQTTIDMRLAVQQQVAQGLLQGLSGQDIRNRLLQTGLTNIPHWPSADYRAGVIARTETMRAYNDGAMAAIEETGAKFVRWIASPDEATCSICQPRDGKVYRLPGSVVGGADDPYGPAIGPLPSRPPAHPRCRCTIRAEYRGPDGRLIEDQLPVALEAPEPPVPGMPPAVGDLDTALGMLDGRVGRLYTSGRADWRDDPFVQFWRNAGTFDEAAIGKILKATRPGLAGFRAFDDLLLARYGIRFVGSSGWTSDLMGASLRALEMIRSRVPRYVTDSKHFKLLGQGPPGAGGFALNTIAECFATGEIRGNMSAWQRYVGRELRAGPGIDGSLEVILHEIAHSIQNRYGAHYKYGYVGVESGGDLLDAHNFAEAFEKEWLAVRRKTAPMIAPTNPNADPLNELRQQVAKYASYNVAPPKSLSKALADAEKGVGTKDMYPTEYAKRGGQMEDFAESAMMYVLNPAKLAKFSPNRYRFMRDRIFEGKR